MAERYASTDLERFVGALFEAEGLAGPMAAVVARGFLEAELLGYPSHGLVRVPVNLEWIRRGETESTGEPVVLAERAALANWDAHRLPGHWAMHLAVSHALTRVHSTGTFTLILRRCQHVACLAAALTPVIEADAVALAMVSSPEEAFVSPFGGSERLFSNNPIAFAAPASAGPVLFDLSMAITAGGQVARAARQGRRLREPAIKLPGGRTSSDPEELARGGSVMPLGGLGHGHKGHALTLMTEVLTQALGGFGRASSRGASEQNSVFLSVYDPAAFTPMEDFRREVDHVVAMVEASPADDPAHPVRVPGRRAWAARSRALTEGVVLDDGVVAALAGYAQRAAVPLPERLD